MCSACHFVLVGMDRVTVHTVSFESETFQISNLVGQRVLSVNELSSPLHVAIRWRVATFCCP